jgi:hypothetical protein
MAKNRVNIVKNIFIVFCLLKFIDNEKTSILQISSWLNLQLFFNSIFTDKLFIGFFPNWKF